jgi:hypothetical protein
MEENFSILKTPKKGEDGTQSCSTKGIQKHVSNSGSIVRLITQLLKGSTL